MKQICVDVAALLEGFLQCGFSRKLQEHSFPWIQVIKTEQKNSYICILLTQKNFKRNWKYILCLKYEIVKQKQKLANVGIFCLAWLKLIDLWLWLGFWQILLWLGFWLGLLLGCANLWFALAKLAYPWLLVTVGMTFSLPVQYTLPLLIGFLLKIREPISSQTHNIQEQI